MKVLAKISKEQALNDLIKASERIVKRAGWVNPYSWHKINELRKPLLQLKRAIKDEAHFQ
jgi:hypothetical protein